MRRGVWNAAKNSLAILASCIWLLVSLLIWPVLNWLLFEQFNLNNIAKIVVAVALLVVDAVGIIGGFAITIDYAKDVNGTWMLSTFIIFLPIFSVFVGVAIVGDYAYSKINPYN